MKISKLIILYAVFFITGCLYAQDEEIIKFAERFADSMVTTAKQPGLIMSITRGDRIIFEKAMGVANIETKEPMDLKMRFRIGSLTKTFTGTVILQLVDEGKLKLDDPVKKFFPDIPNAENITVRMLGDMSSGLFSYSELKEMEDSMIAKPFKKWKPEELVEMSVRKGVYFPPGQGWHYSNTNTILLGMIIEKITGATLASEIKKRIFDRLGMTESEFPSDSSFTGFHPKGYNDDDSKFSEPLTDMTEKYDPSWAWAAGAIISSIKDIKIYIKALAEGTLISPESQIERLRWSYNTPGAKYGFAIFKVGDDFLGHNGSIPGFRNFSAYSPGRNITIIVVYNSQTNRDPDDFWKEIKPIIEK